MSRSFPDARRYQIHTSRVLSASANILETVRTYSYLKIDLKYPFLDFFADSRDGTITAPGGHAILWSMAAPEPVLAAAKCLPGCQMIKRGGKGNEENRQVLQFTSWACEHLPDIGCIICGYSDHYA